MKVYESTDYWEKSNGHGTVMLWISVATSTLYQITDFTVAAISFILLCDHTYVFKFQHDIFKSWLYMHEVATLSNTS